MAKFDDKDYTYMMEVMKICVLCEREIVDANQGMNFGRYTCGCLCHLGGNCRHPHVRSQHAFMQNTCVGSGLKATVVEGFVRKTYPNDSVESAFTKFMSASSPYLGSILREKGNSEKIVELGNEVSKLRKDFSHSKLVQAEQRADEATRKLAVISGELEKMKREWSQVQKQNLEGGSKSTKMTSLDFSPAIGSDEHVLKVEWDNFKQKFSQVHETVQTLLQNSFDTRNSSLINSTVMKVGSATAVTNEARNSVVEVLKRETGKLNELSLTRDVVETGNKNDAQLLD